MTTLLSLACGPSPAEELPPPDEAVAALEEAVPRTQVAAPRCLRQGDTTLARRGVRSSSGALSLGTWGGREVALVADADEDALHVVDVEDMKRLSTTALPQSPAHLLILRDGRVAVSLRYANRVAILEPNATPEEGLVTLCVEAVAREPLALAERGDELLVVSGFGSQLVRLQRDNLAVTRRIDLSREPRGLLLSRDGDTAWVSHMVGGVLSKVDLESHVVQTVTTHRRNLDPKAPSRAVQGFDLAAHVDGDGFERLLMPQVNSADPNPEQEVPFRYYGSTETTFSPWVASVDAIEGKMLGIGAEWPFSWRRICMLPRAAVVYQDRLFVACLDKGSVIEMDARFMDPMTAVYRQYRVAAGPSALAMTGDGTMFVWSLFAHELTRLTVPKLDGRPIAAVPQPRGVRLPLPRRVETRWTASRLQGREVFVARDDDRISKTGAACESCHPDGRDDGLLWGKGNATISLAGRLAGTEPFGWQGKHGDLEARVHSTLGRLLGEGLTRGRDQPKLAGLLEYLRTRRSPPPPVPHSQSERTSIQSGERIFSQEMSCSACHPNGNTNGNESRIDECIFDNPSLAFVGGTAPYFHDNRYPTLEALLSDPKSPMDQTNKLTEATRADLANYLRSLPHGPVDAWPAIDESATASWQTAKPKSVVTQTLDHPGRYLQERPVELDLSAVPTFAMPDMEKNTLGTVWLSLRNEEGIVLGGGSGTMGDIIVSNDAPSGADKLVPRIFASAHGKPALEMMSCRTGSRPSYYWGTSKSYDVVCPDEGTRFEAMGLGRYGFALRTTMNAREVLLTIGPDAFAKYEGGAIEDIGNKGRGFLDLHALRSRLESTRSWCDCRRTTGGGSAPGSPSNRRSRLSMWCGPSRRASRRFWWRPSRPRRCLEGRAD